ncbi:hypothetical protein ACSMXN_04670 [Jatrophihabitans sp. DSM 45814]
MNKAMLAVLNDSERLLVAETASDALAQLDEDATVALHERIRRARGKFVGLYRRGASAKVAEQGGRGMARPKNTTAATKAEVFEDALARVSARLAVLARATAAELRSERIAAARTAKAGQTSGSATAGGKQARGGRAGVAANPDAKASLRTPASEKRRASTQASGARRQAKRDSR